MTAFQPQSLPAGEGRLRDVFPVEALQDALHRDAVDEGQDTQDVEAGHHQAVPRQPQLEVSQRLI